MSTVVSLENAVAVFKIPAHQIMTEEKATTV